MKATQKVIAIIYLLIFANVINASDTITINGQSPNDLIQRAVIQKHRLDVFPHTNFKAAYLQDDFFVEYSDIDLTELHPSIALIPFICQVVPVVWASGKTLFIDYLDEDFSRSLENVRLTLKRFYPSLKWSGRLVARQLVKNANTVERENEYAVLFSGGVDSVCASVRKYPAKQLLVAAWGSDVHPHNKKMWDGVDDTCKDFAKQLGHEYTYLRSNFCYLFNPQLNYVTPEIPAWWKYTTMGLAYCGLAAPIAFARGCKQLLFGSTYDKKYPYPSGSHPLLEGNLSFGGVKVEHDSFDINRQEKIKLITDFSKQQNQKMLLRVCWGGDADGGNCNGCLVKCLQTMNALLIEGEDPRDYGFMLSPQEIITRTQRQFLFMEKPSLSIGGTNRWQDMQERARELLAQWPESDERFNQQLKDYFLWFLTLDIESYNKDKQVPFTKID